MYCTPLASWFSEGQDRIQFFLSLVHVNEVLNHIVFQAYSNYGDIIRHTMSKCREISNTAFAKALLLSLQQEFEKLLDDNEGSADTNSKDFAAIKVKF